VDAPAGRGAQVLVVVAQVPHQVGDLAVASRPVVRDARDAAKGVVRFGLRGVHLADELMLGPFDGHQRSHCGAHPGLASVHPHRSELVRRIWDAQFRCIGEQFDDVAEAAVVDGRRVQVDEIGEGQPVGERELHAVSTNRCAQADS